MRHHFHEEEIVGAGIHVQESKLSKTMLVSVTNVIPRPSFFIQATDRRTILAMNIPRNTPLQQQIDEFIAEGASWLPPDLLRDLLRPIGQLVTSGAAEKALKEGARAPDFTLPDARGNAMRLSHLLRQGPVVISFYQGQWCPYCHLAL